MVNSHSDRERVWACKMEKCITGNTSDANKTKSGDGNVDQPPKPEVKKI